MTKATDRKGETAPKWIACHDTLVCSGAKEIQKWCVREGDERGRLIAVMLTKDVAFLLAASPAMYAALENAIESLDRDGPKAAAASLNTHGRTALSQARGQS